MGLITATVCLVRSNVLVNYESEFQQRAARITKVTGVVSFVMRTILHSFDKDGQREAQHLDVNCHFNVQQQYCIEAKNYPCH